MRIALCACCLFLAACGGGGGGVDGQVSVTPKALPYTGGAVTVDYQGEASAARVVSVDPLGDSLTSEMSAAGEGVFTLAVSIPANTADDNLPAEHRLDLRVDDAEGSDRLLRSFTITVEPMHAPPAPPAIQ